MHEPNSTVTLPYAVLECRMPNGVQKIEIHRLRGDSFAAIKKPFDSWLAEWQAQIEDQRLKRSESQARIQLVQTQRWAEIERVRIERQSAESMRKISQRIGAIYAQMRYLSKP